MDEQAIINELQVSLMRAQEEILRLRKAIKKIEDEIIAEQKMPSYHNTVIERHRLEWGTLHIAIERAIEELYK